MARFDYLFLNFSAKDRNLLSSLDRVSLATAPQAPSDVPGDDIESSG
jgi:hypothetical protein